MKLDFKGEQKMIDNSQRGAALLTTLLIGVLALALVSALLSFIIFGKQTSVHEEKYRNTLEAAKGGAYYIMRKLDIGGTIKCYNHANTSKSCNCNITTFDTSDKAVKCPDGSVVDRIDLGSYSVLSSPDGSNFNLEAILHYKKTTTDSLYDIYSITIIATKNGSSEKSEIDFIYKAPRP